MCEDSLVWFQQKNKDENPPATGPVGTLEEPIKTVAKLRTSTKKNRQKSINISSILQGQKDRPGNCC